MEAQTELEQTQAALRWALIHTEHWTYFYGQQGNPDNLTGWECRHCHTLPRTYEKAEYIHASICPYRKALELVRPKAAVQP